jgi:hypothetical protein
MVFLPISPASYTARFPPSPSVPVGSGLWHRSAIERCLHDANERFRQRFDSVVEPADQVEPRLEQRVHGNAAFDVPVGYLMGYEGEYASSKSLAEELPPAPSRDLAGESRIQESRFLGASQAVDVLELGIEAEE